uniref:HTH CENPB-type domain-containing protein n=1 Tax=Peronospora matthiolae TaxID=2874970 RepID=A0AAV1UP45_9STRA
MSQIRLTNEQKLRICKHEDANPRITQTALAAWTKDAFDLQKALSQAAISKIIKKRKELEAMDTTDLSAKRPRTVQHPAVEEAVAFWVLQCQHRGVALTGHLIRAKAQTFSGSMGVSEENISFSHGWLHKFQQRHKLRAVRIHGDSGSANMGALEEALPHLKAVVAGYAPRDVYNMDETGLFYSMTPDKTIAQQEVEGFKKDKTRITVALTANADGSDKLPPVFIGHAKKPRCFERKTAERLGFLYRNNKKVWMTGILFQEWLGDVDKSMKQKDRKILLLMDNAPSHIVADLELTNITVQVLPPNTTSKVQPMDAGIIAAFKRHYGRLHLQNAFDRDERGETNLYKVDQLTAMRWSLAAWSEISSATIANCFRHTGLMDGPALPTVEEQRVEQDLVSALERLPLRNPMSIASLLNPAEEEETAHAELTYAEIIKLVEDPYGEEEGAAEAEEEVEKHSKAEKLASLSLSIALLDLSQESHRIAHRTLRQVQADLRSASTTQATLDSWLK